MASIGDPFVLSTYSQPKSAARAGPSGLSNVFASNQHASTSSSEGYVTVAAQGDGVHVLDLASLHPAISYTLGPQVRFSCAPVTRTTTQGSSRICTTYVVVESAPNLDADESGRTVWRWKEDPAGNVTAAEAQKRRISVVAPHKVAHLYAPEGLPEQVVVVGTGSQITVLDESLAVKSIFTPEETEDLLASTFIPRQTNLFAPSGSPTQGNIAILVGQKDSAVHVQVVSIDEHGVSQALGQCPIPLESSQGILNVTCSNTGYISILTSQGIWHSYELQATDGEIITLSKTSDCVSLGPFSFSSPSSSVSQPSPTRQEVSITSLSSSHVLLAGFFSSSNNEITFLLWDLRYSVVLATQTHPIPSTLGRSKKNPVELKLIAGASSPSQAVLVLSPRPTRHAVNGISEDRTSSSDPASRSTVLIVPLSVPPTSKISNAIGRASASAKWISTTSTLSDVAPVDGTRAKLLRVMRAAVDQNRTEAANEAFFNWIKQEVAKAPKTPEGAHKNEVQLGHKFVQDVLEALLKQPKGVTENIPYSPKVVRYLLERRAVSSGMVDGGLLPALGLRRDWESIVLALKTVIDIPEADLASFLHDVIVAQSKASSQADDSMQVDSATEASLPSLSDLLSLYVTYPTSAAAMRVAIRKHVKEGNELVAILTVLLGWVESWSNEEGMFLPEEAKKGEHGIMLPVLEEHKKDDIPPIDKVLNFVQILLDSSFLTFLSHPPSHKLMRQIMACLQPEVTLNDEIEQLQGPLQPFVRAQAKAVSDAVNGPPKLDPKVDWRQRKKALHEQAGMSVGLYQVEELVL